LRSKQKRCKATELLRWKQGEPPPTSTLRVSATSARFAGEELREITDKSVGATAHKCQFYCTAMRVTQCA